MSLLVAWMVIAFVVFGVVPEFEHDARGYWWSLLIGNGRIALVCAYVAAFMLFIGATAKLLIHYFG